MPARHPYFRQGQSLLSHAEATPDGWRKTFLQPFPSRAGGKCCAGCDSIHLISLLESPRPSPNPESQKQKGRKQKWVWSSRRCWMKHDGAAELCCHPRDGPGRDAVTSQRVGALEDTQVAPPRLARSCRGQSRWSGESLTELIPARESNLSRGVTGEDREEERRRWVEGERKNRRVCVLRQAEKHLRVLHK